MEFLWNVLMRMHRQNKLILQYLKTGTANIIEVLQDARLSLNGFPHPQFSQDSLAFSAILRVNGISHFMAKPIITIVI